MGENWYFPFNLKISFIEQSLSNFTALNCAAKFRPWRVKLATPTVCSRFWNGEVDIWLEFNYDEPKTRKKCWISKIESTGTVGLSSRISWEPLLRIFHRFDKDFSSRLFSKLVKADPESQSIFPLLTLPSSYASKTWSNANYLNQSRRCNRECYWMFASRSCFDESFAEDPFCFGRKIRTLWSFESESEKQKWSSSSHIYLRILPTQFCNYSPILKYSYKKLLIFNQNREKLEFKIKFYIHKSNWIRVDFSFSHFIFFTTTSQFYSKSCTSFFATFLHSNQLFLCFADSHRPRTFWQSSHELAYPNLLPSRFVTNSNSP